MAEITVVGSLAVLSIIGVALAFFGFELARPLLRWAGAVFGAGIGAVLAFGIVPEVLEEAPSLESQLAVGIGGLVIGAVLGYHFIPFVGRVAASVAAFVASSGATLLVLVGDEVIDASLAALPEDPLADPLETVEALTATPIAEMTTMQEPLAIALVVGIIGAGLAFKYYTDIIALAATVGGAAIIGGAVPMWFLSFDAEQAFDPAAAEFSVFWFAVALVLGAGFQLTRHFDALDPRSEDFILDD